jgi:UDP-3-O-[3-hydroxymyristoyl] glucosamine N-acyltransferase
MNLTAKELFSESGKKGVILELKGNQNVQIENIAAFNNGKKGDLIFVPDEKAFKVAVEGNCSAMVIDKKLEELAVQISAEVAVFISANIALSHAIIKLQYHDHDYTQSGWDRIHPSSIIHKPIIRNP